MRAPKAVTTPSCRAPTKRARRDSFWAEFMMSLGLYFILWPSTRLDALFASGQSVA